MTDATILTQIVQLLTNYPIQVGLVLFFGALVFGVFRLELSKFR